MIETLWNLALISSKSQKHPGTGLLPGTGFLFFFILGRVGSETNRNIFKSISKQLYTHLLL